MNISRINPVAKPAQWLLDILEMTQEEFIESTITTSYLDVTSITLTLELSNNPDDIMSAAIAATYVINRGLDIDNMLQTNINKLKQERWEKLLTMKPIVAREVIRLFAYLVDTPSALMYETRKHLFNNTMLSNAIAKIWTHKDWPLSPEVVFVISRSCYGWKFLHKLNNHKNATSRDICCAIMDSDPDMWAVYRMLISLNGSALEYLLYLDHIHGDGVVNTIATIDEFILWGIMRTNGAAGIIVDYILETSEHAAKQNLSIMTSRNWVIPLICENEMVAKYVTIDDIKCKRIDNTLFTNPFAIDIIAEWIKQTRLTNDLIEGLVEIACCQNKTAALKALSILGNRMIAGLSNRQLSNLLVSPHGRKPTMDALKQEDLVALTDELLYANKCIPYFTVDSNGVWYLENLTTDTLQNVNDCFYDHLSESAHLINRDNWITLFSTESGVHLGIIHIDYVVDSGVLFALLINPMISKTDLLQLHETTDTFEYCDDEDFMALVNRDDIYESDLNIVFQLKHDLCQDVLRTWYNPDRIMAISDNIREYLNAYD